LDASYHEKLRIIDAGHASGRFRDVDHHRNFQGRSATRAFLTGRDAGVLASKIDFGGHGMRAHGAVGHSLSAALLKGLHFFLLLTYSDASEVPNVFEIFVKISKR
jgi:hypothetical protein